MSENTQEQEVVQESQVESQEVSENSPQQEQQEQQVDETEILRKKVAEESYKRREQRRRAEEAESRLKELEEKATPKFDGSIPEAPDPFDDDFESKMRAREDAIARKAQADAFATQQREQQAEQQRKREREEFQKAEEIKHNFWKNADSLGVSEESLRTSAGAIVKQGVTPEVEDFIMQDKEGPLMVQYLAANPLELEVILEETNPMKVGAMLSELKNKSSSLKPKTSNAPNPPDIVDGETPSCNQRGPKGATFE
jgi:hypothetical protein